MENKQKLLDLIQKSSLNESEKSEWESFISSYPDGFIEALWEVFSKFPDEISWFNETLKRKKDALKLMESDPVGGKDIMRKIFEDEKVKMTGLLNKTD